MKNTLLFFLLTTLLLAKSVQDSTLPITFEGNHYVKRTALEEVVGAHRPSPLAVWKKNIATIDSILLPKLDETFRLFYKNEGLYDANVSNYVDKDGIHVIIEEKQPILIDDIKIESDLDLKDKMILKKNQRFRSEDFGITKKNIRKLLLSEGYCSPNLDTKAYIDLEKHTATIKVKLEKRNICHFGEVTIENPSSTMKNDIILSRLHFKEGDVFDIDKIKESYESLYILEAFDQLNLDYRLNFYNEKPIKITYKEIGKHIHTRMGIGYATDLKFQGKYYWEYKNFRGNGKKLIFESLLSQKQKNIENSFFVPYVTSIADYYLDFENRVGYTEEQGIHSYDEKVLYERLYLSHSSSRWYNSIGLGIENREISNDKTFFLIYPFIKMVYDRRNSKLNPTQGLYFSHEMEYGLPYSPDSTTYLKYLEELRAIYTISDVTFSAVGRMGAIKIYSNGMPESKKFFAGGAFSNRAYGYDQIGITQSATTDSMYGGYTLANVSLESNFPIYKDFRGALFSDNTMISENQGIWEFNNNVIYSAGLGFRYLTPIGPFKIDMGFNVRNESERAVHFQVGQSF